MAENEPKTMADRITERLQTAFQPTSLQVINESHLHAGHAGDDGSGESHFRVIIESPAFTGQNRVARQRAVNNVLADLLRDHIHALTLTVRG